jgi:uncharacterized membrane protein
VRQASQETLGARGALEQLRLGLRELFKGLRLAVADRFVMSCFIAFLLLVGGFASFFLAWNGSASTVAVGVQLAYLASGGLGGFALIGFGVGLLYTQISRRLAAHEDLEWQIVLDRALALLVVLKTSGGDLGKRSAANYYLRR